MTHLAISVPFYDSTLYIVKHQGEAYVPMKPIVDGMGIDWMEQLSNLKKKFNLAIEKIPMVTEDGAHQKIELCLPLRKLVGWLHTINPNKVKQQIRDNVIQFQNECDDVLWDYWTKGQVTHSCKVKQSYSISEPLDAVDIRNLKWLINIVVTRFKYKDAWNQGIWYSLRHVTNTPSPQLFRVDDLPVLAQEFRRIMGVTGETSDMICQFEKDVLKICHS